MVTSMLEIINKILWAVATIFILSSSLYFSFLFLFPQLKIKTMVSKVLKKMDSGITPFQSLMMVLAGRIGVGSIAGVAFAIYIGGPGSIFWMWITAFFTAVNAFLETILGVIYHKKDRDDIYIGGPSYYIDEGLGNHKLGRAYAILILISYIGGFIGIQANTITKSFTEISKINPLIIAIVLAVTTFLIIYKGTMKIAKVTSTLVPFMSIFYIFIALYIVVTNITLIPSILLNIVKSAFQLKSLYGGFIGTFIIGLQRGIFSNEAGLGTGAIAASSINTKDGVSQGYVQMLGVYITTFLVCSATAIIILSSDYNTLVLNDINGIEITQYAFTYHLGELGKFIIFLAIFLFSFSTILAGYYNGETSLKYLLKKVSNRHILTLKIITVILIFISSLISASLIWNLVDILVALLAIINIYALFKLKDRVQEEVIYYKSKKCDKI